MRFNRILAAAAASVVATTSLVACSSDSASEAGGADGDAVTVKIGTTDADMLAWTAFEDEAEKLGIDLDIVRFSEYPQVNPAHVEGQMKVSKFQTINYQAQYNADSGEDLRIIGSGEINVLGLYWKDHDSLDGIEGEEVAIPNDPSNQGRAINVLVQAGLLTLNDNVADPLTPTPAEINKDESKVTVTPVDASQTPNAYNEGKPAIINNTWLDRAGIEPSLAVFEDDPESKEAEPYINVFAARSEDISDETLNKLVELWQTPEVAEATAKDSKGTSVPVYRDQKELNDILDRLQNK